jgi:hypothetical protein
MTEDNKMLVSLIEALHKDLMHLEIKGAQAELVLGMNHALVRARELSLSLIEEENANG